MCEGFEKAINGLHDLYQYEGIQIYDIANWLSQVKLNTNSKL